MTKKASKVITGRLFEEVDLPNSIGPSEIPDGFSVRVFKTYSDSDPHIAYYVQAVKQAKDPWDRAVLLCNCDNAQTRQCLAVMGDKTTCKHSRDLRAGLQGHEDKGILIGKQGERL